MHRRLAPVIVPLLLLVGCADESTPESAPSSASSPAVDPAVQAGVETYRAYVVKQVDALVGDTKKFTDAVRAGNVAKAQAEFAPSRQSWERIEPIAGLVDVLDGKLDARVDDFASTTDPAWTGWHRLEHQLFEQKSTKDSAPFADQLDEDIATLKSEIQTLEIPASAVATGAAELIEEVSKGKITGEEDRYSGTDLWDFAANVEGAQAAVDALRPAITAKDPELLTQIDEEFAAVNSGLKPYKRGAGWAPYSALTATDKDRLTAQLGALSETLARVPGALGL